MAKFICKKCGNEIELQEYTLKTSPFGIVSEQAKCCNTYMTRTVSKQGFGGIKKGPDGTVKSKKS